MDSILNSPQFYIHQLI